MTQNSVEVKIYFEYKQNRKAIALK